MACPRWQPWHASAVRPFLNIDAGELETEPDELYAAAHAVNIACGGHAGDEASMERVLRACARTGGTTRAGAHPSYDDRDGFGRRELAVVPETLARSVRAQCARLAAIARKCDVVVTHVKVHGALYHAANRDAEIARAVVAGAVTALGRVLVMGPAEGELQRAAERAGCVFAREGFADRGIRADGSLVPRGENGALVTDVSRVRARAKALATSGGVDTICVHGDTPGSLALARAVREELDAT
jgi:UPF0271 protein